MNDNEFWLRIYKYLSIVVCVFIVGSFSSCQSSKYQIRKAIEAGSSPVEVACAFELGAAVSDTICAVELMRK